MTTADVYRAAQCEVVEQNESFRFVRDLVSTLHLYIKQIGTRCHDLASSETNASAVVRNPDDSADDPEATITETSTTPLLTSTPSSPLVSLV